MGKPPAFGGRTLPGSQSGGGLSHSVSSRRKEVPTQRWDSHMSYPHHLSSGEHGLIPGTVTGSSSSSILPPTTPPPTPQLPRGHWTTTDTHPSLTDHSSQLYSTQITGFTVYRRPPTRFTVCRRPELSVKVEPPWTKLEADRNCRGPPTRFTVCRRLSVKVSSRGTLAVLPLTPCQPRALRARQMASPIPLR